MTCLGQLGSSLFLPPYVGDGYCCAGLRERPCDMQADPHRRPCHDSGHSV